MREHLSKSREKHEQKCRRHGERKRSRTRTWRRSTSSRAKIGELVLRYHRFAKNGRIFAVDNIIVHCVLFQKITSVFGVRDQWTVDFNAFGIGRLAAILLGEAFCSKITIGGTVTIRASTKLEFLTDPNSCRLTSGIVRKEKSLNHPCVRTWDLTSNVQWVQRSTQDKRCCEFIGRKDVVDES